MLSVLANRIILNLRGVILKGDSDDDMANVELTKVNVFTTGKRLTVRQSAPATPQRGFFRPPYLHSEMIAEVIAQDDTWKEDDTNYAASIKSETV